MHVTHCNAAMLPLMLWRLAACCFWAGANVAMFCQVAELYLLHAKVSDFTDDWVDITLGDTWLDAKLDDVMEAFVPTEANCTT